MEASNDSHKGFGHIALQKGVPDRAKIGVFGPLFWASTGEVMLGLNDSHKGFAHIPLQKGVPDRG